MRLFSSHNPALFWDKVLARKKAFKRIFFYIWFSEIQINPIRSLFLCLPLCVQYGRFLPPQSIPDFIRFVENKSRNYTSNCAWLRPNSTKTDPPRLKTVRTLKFTFFACPVEWRLRFEQKSPRHLPSHAREGLNFGRRIRPQSTRRVVGLKRRSKPCGET